MSGDYHNLPAELQRWDKPFGANPGAWHDVAVGPIAAGDTSANPWVWWRDPLARGAGYHGEWVQWFTIFAFALAPADVLIFGRNAWVAATPTPPAPTPPPVKVPPAPTPQPVPVPPVPPVPVPKVALTYKVAPGDSLSRIGRRFNARWQDIYAANAHAIGANPNAIRVGMVLTIPGHFI
jgi:hypothetical protein